jgi:lysylphosphatidylglycerol synthetase-like protein (DUF2156 family)
MGSSLKSITPLKAAQALFFLNAAIWLAFGVVSLVRLKSTNPDFAVTAAFIAVLMFGNATAMLVSGWGIGKRWKWFYYLALAVLAVNILLTFTDEFGAFDFITLVIDLVLLGLLIVIRKRWSAPRPSDAPQSPPPPSPV